MRLEKALKVVTEELKEELQTSPEEFLFQLWTDAITKEFKALKSWDFEKFEKAVKKELEERNWDIYQFRNTKGEPITNVFKKLVRMIAKEEGQEISNDSLSRILNVIRKQYAGSGKLAAGLYPPVAFRERASWGIPEDLGDSNSCFHFEKGNEGNVDWLIREYELARRAYFVVFHYTQHPNNKEGRGRCWVIAIDNALFATNFYSKYFELKDQSFKYVIVRLLRKLFDLSEKVKFAAGKEAPLPIYLNGDGLVIYEPSSFKNSNEVINTIGELESVCLWCENKKKVRELNRYSNPVDYQAREVSGLVICDQCKKKLMASTPCEDCGELYDVEDMISVGSGYVCQSCFERNWVYCDICGELLRREYSISTHDEKTLCSDCAVELGKFCNLCDKFFYNEDNRIKKYRINVGYTIDIIYLCDNCAEKRLRSYRCECGKEVYYLSVDLVDRRLKEMVRLGKCLDCYRRQRWEA